MQLSINNQEGFIMLQLTKQLWADRPYLPVSGSQGGVLLAQAAASQGKLLAKAIACAQQVDNVICRSQARLASRWASRRLTSADLVGDASSGRSRRLQRWLSCVGQRIAATPARLLR